MNAIPVQIWWIHTYLYIAASAHPASTRALVCNGYLLYERSQRQWFSQLVCVLQSAQHDPEVLCVCVNLCLQLFPLHLHKPDTIDPSLLPLSVGFSSYIHGHESCMGETVWSPETDYLATPIKLGDMECPIILRWHGTSWETQETQYCLKQRLSNRLSLLLCFSVLFLRNVALRLQQQWKFPRLQGVRC